VRASVFLGTSADARLAAVFSSGACSQSSPQLANPRLEIRAFGVSAARNGELCAPIKRGLSPRCANGLCVHGRASERLESRDVKKPMR
jgi:hypothetical protein